MPPKRRESTTAPSKKKPATKNRQKKKKNDQQPLYPVEKILEKKVENGVEVYLIQWKHYSSAFNSWEPKENFNEEMIIEAEKYDAEHSDEDEGRKVSIHDYFL
jgi:phosphoribosylaminoimidazole carboxylase (NCAIR synthetase)